VCACCKATGGGVSSCYGPGYGGVGIGRGGGGYAHYPAAAVGGPPSEFSVDSSSFISQRSSSTCPAGPGPGAPAVGRGLAFSHALAVGRGHQLPHGIGEDLL